LKRTKALSNLRTKPDFEPLAVAFKRVVNIIKKARQQGDLAPQQSLAKADSSMFQEQCEGDLYDAFQKVRQEAFEDILQRGDFNRALLTVSTLKGPVDGFFDGVMVLAEDQRVRQNRLALLGEIADFFSTFADFSKIST
jgi:glycyl-tRNA synthetase beta chain